MKASQRYRLRRLADELNGERGTWLAADPPAWDWPESWGRRYYRLLFKHATFAVRYGSAGKPLDPARKG